MLRNKKSIFFVLFILLHVSAISQRFNAGIAAAIVATDIYGPDIVPDADAWNDPGFHKAGIMLGGGLNTPLNKKFTLRLEINYIQKGTQQRADSTGKGYYKFSFNYAEVPLILKYRFQFKSEKQFTQGFEMHAGISAGRLIKNKGQGDNFYFIDDYSYFNRTDVSLLAGVGYNFFNHFNFSIRYSNSIIPVLKHTVSSIQPLQTFNYGNNMVLHFMLQYMFGAEKNHSVVSDEPSNPSN